MQKVVSLPKRGVRGKQKKSILKFKSQLFDRRASTHQTYYPKMSNDFMLTPHQKRLGWGFAKVFIVDLINAQNKIKNLKSKGLAFNACQNKIVSI